MTNNLNLSSENWRWKFLLLNACIPSKPLTKSQFILAQGVLYFIYFKIFFYFFFFFLQWRTVLCLWGWRTVEFLMKHSQLHPRTVPAIFQIEADSTYYQVAGNLVGQLVRIMPTSGFRYKLGPFISRSKSMYVESKIKIPLRQLLVPSANSFWTLS